MFLSSQWAEYDNLVLIENMPITPLWYRSIVYSSHLYLCYEFVQQLRFKQSTLGKVSRVQEPRPFFFFRKISWKLRSIGNDVSCIQAEQRQVEPSRRLTLVKNDTDGGMQGQKIPTDTPGRKLRMTFHVTTIPASMAFSSKRYPILKTLSKQNPCKISSPFYHELWNQAVHRSIKISPPKMWNNRDLSFSLALFRWPRNFEDRLKVIHSIC